MSSSGISCEIAPSGIGAPDPDDVRIIDPDTTSTASGAATAASADGVCSINVEELVQENPSDPEARKSMVALIEKLRELIKATYGAAADASVLLAFVHWYGDIVPLQVLKTRAPAISSYVDASQLLAAVVTQIAEILCGTTVEIVQPRQNNVELCYSIRWPLPLTPQHSQTKYCRGSRAVVAANADRFVDMGWIDKETNAFKPEHSDEAFDQLHDNMKTLSMATQALKMGFDRFRKEKSFSDYTKLYEYLFYDVPPLTTPNFPDFLWRIHQILSVFTNPNYSDKRQYSVEDKKLQVQLNDEEMAAEALRMSKATAALGKK
jgi:hypothetical protein